MEDPFKHNTPPPENRPSEKDVAWEARQPLHVKKDFFDFQLQFAQILSKKADVPLVDIIASATSELRKNAFNHDEYKMLGIKDGVTEENIADFAYEEYLKSVRVQPVEYHPEGSERFGCFYYDQDSNEPSTIRIHFTNNEFDTVSPLDQTKIQAREKELKDVLNDIKLKFPETQKIHGESWLVNLPAFMRLLPDSMKNNAVIDERRMQWARGTTIWGQFIDSQYNLKQDLAQELLERAKELPKDAHMSELFKNGSRILPPLATQAPISDFYAMYGVE